MKRALIICSITGLLAVILFSTCKKSDIATIITGKWAKIEFQGIQQYKFNSDKTFEYDAFATDSVTKAVLGYWYKTTGKYTITNSQITFYSIQTFSTPGSTFVPASALVAINGSTTVSYTFTLDNEQRKLSLYFTCPPYADCVPSPLVYQRQ